MGNSKTVYLAQFGFKQIITQQIRSNDTVSHLKISGKVGYQLAIVERI